MKIEISKPSLKLSGFIKQFWAIDSCVANGFEHTQRIVPHGLPELTFYLENKPKNFQFSGSSHNSAFVSGQMNKYFDLRLSGIISIFSIQFSPFGLSAIFNLPASELKNLQLPLNDLIGNVADTLTSKLQEFGCFFERVKITEDFILHRLAKCYDQHAITRISYALNLINKTKGNISIDKLASNVCISRKQFERLFLKIVGATPKQFLKVIRFQGAILNKSQSKNLNLTELTYLSGYFDQSHMINDFKQLTGYSPKRFFSNGEAISDYFT